MTARIRNTTTEAIIDAPPTVTSLTHFLPGMTDPRVKRMRLKALLEAVRTP